MAVKHKTWRTPKRVWDKLKPVARNIRHKPTPAEHMLWQRLRRSGPNEYGFRRQHPLGRFIVDFYCPARKLVVEIDGSVHDRTVLEDRARQTHLEDHGYYFIRFRNDEVLHSIEWVLARVAAALDNPVDDRESEYKGR